VAEKLIKNSKLYKVWLPKTLLARMDREAKRFGLRPGVFVRHIIKMGMFLLEEEGELLVIGSQEEIDDVETEQQKEVERLQEKAEASSELLSGSRLRAEATVPVSVEGLDILEDAGIT